MADVKPRGAEKSAAAKSAARRREPLARRRAAEDSAKNARLPLGSRNWQLIGAGLAVIVIGFIALAKGSMTLAPFLLVAGYCVLLPMGLLWPAPDSTPTGDSAPAAGE